MADYLAEQSAISDDCYTIYRKPQQQAAMVYGFIGGGAPLPTRTKILSLCGQTEESIKKILKRYECPKIVTTEDKCDD